MTARTGLRIPAQQPSFADQSAGPSVTPPRPRSLTSVRCPARERRAGRPTLEPAISGDSVTVAAPPETTDLTDALHRAGVAVGDIDRVVSMHQRSLCYRVDLSDGASLFVKRARRSATGEWSADVVAEGVRLQQLSTLLPGQDCFPAALVLDPDQRMLVTAGYPDHTQLDIARDAEDAGPALAHALGIALAALHSVSRPDAAIVSGTPIPSADCAESVLTTLLRPTPTRPGRVPRRLHGGAGCDSRPWSGGSIDRSRRPYLGAMPDSRRPEVRQHLVLEIGRHPHRRLGDLGVG